MRRPWLVSLGAFLMLAVVTTGVKEFFFNFKIRKPGGPPPSWSAAESKENEVWICDVSVEPNKFTVGERTYRLSEAWIEEAFEDEHFLVWFPYRKNSDGTDFASECRDMKRAQLR